MGVAVKSFDFDIINWKQDLMAGHMNIMPFIILNMGGEMIFIL